MRDECGILNILAFCYQRQTNGRAALKKQKRQAKFMTMHVWLGLRNFGSASLRC